MTEELLFDFDYEGDDVSDEMPDEEEIRKALFYMRNRKTPGMMGITVEDMKAWYKDAHPEDIEEGGKCQNY